MFFRRQKPHTLSFDERLSALKEAGFTVTSEGAGRARVAKYGCAALVEDCGADVPAVSKAGVVVGQEVGLLVHGGYQQFFETPSGKRLPALAEHLRALHDFQEDLKEALGLVSFYNTSLGSISNRHVYDRVKDREPSARSTASH